MAVVKLHTNVNINHHKCAQSSEVEELRSTFYSNPQKTTKGGKSTMRAFLCLMLVACVSAQVTSPNFANGRTVIVHLFEWPWRDVADECERFLGPFGFAGVQVSPPNEHMIITNPWRPWWERYQPTSYVLNSRSGSISEFKKMVSRCNAVNVRIYVDAVINHMAAGDYNWPNVPYSWRDFNVPLGKCLTGGDIGDTNWGNAEIVRNCNLLGLNDIYFGSENKYYTNQKVADYLNSVIDTGVAGFRVDGAKHMWPGDLNDIFGRLKNTHFGGQPYMYLEVIDRGSVTEAVKAHEYFDTGDVTEFKYCDEIYKLGMASTQAKNFWNFGEGWGMMNTANAVVFVDNHDNQRDHGGGGAILTYKNSWAYKKAIAFGLAWDYGTSRIMSSFDFSDRDQGPPSDRDGNTISPSINYDSTCGNGWICEHRWRQIRNMACFRNAAAGQSVQNWYDNGDNFIAFSRGKRAFFALNNQQYTVSNTLQTGLPAGQYCDVISGEPTGSGCTGDTITVNGSGEAYISISNGEDPMVAIHIGATTSSSGGRCHW